MNISVKSYISKENYFYFIIFIFTIFSRLPSLNNPLIDVDEGFYLFTGGQLLHGYFPFVDIWDRKPFGLFLIYAFFHLFGPYRIIAYQVGATLCVILTAIFIMKMARTIASSTGTLISSLLYVSYLNIAGGEGGQSPVFYNLIVCAALYTLLKYIVNDKYNTQNLCHTTYKVMFLFGIALQIK
ncbi:glycosyltransferase family 39 protein [Acetobacter indonesiensis]|uniref:glycosyltransferase family 39 protein n=1 Tax=Acetobacter indonesiensis TaxID=104101 RepID=UPI001F478005|nr:glycosyltransferase family 39 protein [Acetobacter indonesiensis]MCG0996167.1 glycosyltransferase family 39 protein [Acetobacter indonesiensis]